ncbi:anti-sigma factor [Microbacterium stercoris]|uniref:Anti-sigma factor n=1 Tax=Microbacterium stercoris TaxID=2820289 RepID=A0A939QIL4_9MICO|nr:anti-sigma factor [Microbacterium stercoris]MBO3662352.1 anti-sigma factor [Microbacterium stercoris]MBO3664344.1 anti-sigma factor [Microbacterium stercoris]
MRERDFEELAAGHALNALSPEDERAYRDAVSADATRADLAEADTETAALLADATSPVTPPDRIRAELLARIAATPQHTASTAESRSPEAAGEGTAPGEPTRRAWGPRAWFALAASLVLLGGGGAAAIIATQSLTRPAAVVALDRIESAPDARSAGAEVAGGGDATLHWSVELGAAVLVSRDLPEIAEDRQFELWYVRGDEAIPAGVFDASAETTTALLEEGMRPGDVIAVTVEPHGGSPDGRPSTDPIVAIPTE